VDSRFALPVDTVVDGAYRIERVVGSGGFGITYVAEDINLGTTVALKEYYPFDFGDRDRTMSVRPKSDRHRKTFEWGRSNFLQEARTLARFEHPSIVHVTRVFEANSTAYMVMRFEQGHSFEAWLASLGRPPTQEELDRIAIPLLEALQMMHAENFLHRDIAPDNIVVRADSSPVLLDFGAARRAVGEMSRSLTGVVKAGYSPHEQYSSDGRLQGPWSDFYALGGTLYRAVTGRIPEEATLRVDVDHMPPATRTAMGTYRAGFLSAIDSCLKVRPTERPQSVAELRSMLLGGTPQAKHEVQRSPRTPVAASTPITRRSASTRPLLSRWLAITAAVMVVLGGAYGGYEYTHWQPAEPRIKDAEARQLADLIKLRRKEAADAAQRQVEREAERRREEVADAVERQALIDEERSRKEETERAAAAEEASRKSTAEAEAKRVEEERRQIASRSADEEARLKAQAATKNVSDRESLTRSLQAALNRTGCYRGEIDGQWGPKGRAALVQFAKTAKLDLATDEPSAALLEVVTAKTGRVCPLECADDKIEINGKCVPRPHKASDVEADKPYTGNLNALSLNYWPRNSLAYKGQTVTASTPYGRLTCTSNGRGSPRSCSLGR
jgi:serine/threonine protein kinase